MKARDVPFNLLTLASVQLHQFHTGNVKVGFPQLDGYKSAVGATALFGRQ